MHKPVRVFALLALGCLLGATPVHDPCDKPLLKKTKDGQPDARFVKRHESYVAIAKKGGIDLLLMGDYLVDDFRGNPSNHTKDIYDRAFGPYHPADFGQGGDYTQHVLWRIENGEFDGITPKVMMLMIGGTNGSNGDPPEEIAAGVKAIIDATRQKSPTTKVLLLSVVPWGPPGSRRDRHVSVNALLPKLDDGGKTVKYLDISGKFVDAKGQIPKDVMPEGAHLSDKGYQIWADAVGPVLKEMMEGK